MKDLQEIKIDAMVDIVVHIKNRCTFFRGTRDDVFEVLQEFDDLDSLSTSSSDSSYFISSIDSDSSTPTIVSSLTDDDYDSELSISPINETIERVANLALFQRQEDTLEAIEVTEASEAPNDDATDKENILETNDVPQPTTDPTTQSEVEQNGIESNTGQLEQTDAGEEETVLVQVESTEANVVNTTESSNETVIGAIGETHIAASAEQATEEVSSTPEAAPATAESGEEDLPTAPPAQTPAAIHTPPPVARPAQPQAPIRQPYLYQHIAAPPLLRMPLPTPAAQNPPQLPARAPMAPYVPLFLGPRKKDGTPDFRYLSNRQHLYRNGIHYNINGSIDRRYRA